MGEKGRLGEFEAQTESLLTSLVRSADTRIVLISIDGLGGLPRSPGGMTELEAARTRNLNDLVGRSSCGRAVVCGLGITPGSGSGHLAMFGYPRTTEVPRGVLEALGLGLTPAPHSLAARGNFATVDSEGIVVDRRAGRLSTEECRRLCAHLQDKIEIPGVQVAVAPGRGHRFAVVFDGTDLLGPLTNTDPQVEGVPPRRINEVDPRKESSAAAVNLFVQQAMGVLEGRAANCVLLRGIGSPPSLTPFGQKYGLRGAAIASYPMYRGVARLLGLDLLPTTSSPEDMCRTLKEYFNEYEFFFLHFKDADVAGHDGDFERKVAALEEIDSALADAINLEPDVLVVTGDHSTPTNMRDHSWHPVPTLIHSKYCLGSSANAFNEREALRGELGDFPMTDLMALVLAHGRRLYTYGA